MKNKVRRSKKTTYNRTGKGLKALLTFPLFLFSPEAERLLSDAWDPDQWKIDKESIRNLFLLFLILLSVIIFILFFV